mgnify:CR=1 FL=1
MTERRGDTLLFHTPPVIAAQAAVGGKKESDGPLAAGFDELTTDNRLGQCSWEAAEKQLQLRAARLCLQKAALSTERVDLALAGDLQAQCTASGYALRELGVPFAGLFGACSTMAEALALGAALCSSRAAQNLLLHLKIMDMAAGHDHQVVIGVEGDVLIDLGEIAADKLFRIREALRRYQVSPVVKHSDTETDGMEHRAKGQRAVACAEENGPLADGKRHGEIAGTGGFLRQQGTAAVQRQSQKSALIQGNAAEQLRGKDAPAGIITGDEGE